MNYIMDAHTFADREAWNYFINGIGTKKNNRKESVTMLRIKVKYFSKNIQKLEKLSKGNWIDLRSAEDIELKKGESRLIPLGIGMEIPAGYEVHIVPRSSTFKNFGIIQTNHMGVIDGPDRNTGTGGYCGDDDQWFMSVYAVRDTVIHANDRICQFRLVEQQEEMEFEETERLSAAGRGGFGSTGIQ